jgi:hypothetical protein
MLQGNAYSYGGQRRKFLPNHPVNSNLRPRPRRKSNKEAQRRTIHHGRRRRRFHFARDIDVVRRVRFRIILAIFRERGESRNGNEQEQHANAEAKPPVGGDFSDETCLWLLNIHARIRTTGNFRETPLSAARCRS